MTYTEQMGNAVMDGRMIGNMPTADLNREIEIAGLDVRVWGYAKICNSREDADTVIALLEANGFTRAEADMGEGDESTKIRPRQYSLFLGDLGVFWCDCPDYSPVKANGNGVANGK